LLASLKALTNYKDFPRLFKDLCQFSCARIGQFSPVYIQGRLLEQFSGSQAASKQFLESQISQQQAESLLFIFFTKTAKDCKNHSNFHSKSTVLTLSTKNDLS